jgi:hypothetical protein
MVPAEQHRKAPDNQFRPADLFPSFDEDKSSGSITYWERRDALPIFTGFRHDFALPLQESGCPA